jgi:hypothetical protein
MFVMNYKPPFHNATGATTEQKSQTRPKNQRACYCRRSFGEAKINIYCRE